MIITTFDGDSTIREGDWLRLWNSTGPGTAHEVWVGVGGIVYENSGPGGHVRRSTLFHVLRGRKVIEIIGRTADPIDLARKVRRAESLVGTPWVGFYNCQDFASEVATGKRVSFQRDALLALAALGGLLYLGGRGQ